jgi:tryptophan-rich sensory protein
MQNISKVTISVMIPLIIGGISGAFTNEAIPTWYADLAKPWFNPPNTIFAPVWTLLYILMGMSFFKIWKSDAYSDIVNKAMLYYFLQLAANFFWSFLFFYLEQPGWAFAEIILMWALIFYTIILFGKISPAAAWLLVPYISWVSFAAILNYSIWKLN